MVVGQRVSEAELAYRRGHRFGNAMLTGMLAKLFGRSFTDILSGYRVFSRRFVKSFPVLSVGFEIETEIKEKVQNELGKTQREYMLRQQLEAIRRELGESEDSEETVDNFREAIDSSGMPEEARKQATRELDRLSQTPPAAAEHSVIRTYLEWMTELPWANATEDRLDVEEAQLDATEVES